VNLKLFQNKSKTITETDSRRDGKSKQTNFHRILLKIVYLSHKTVITISFPVVQVSVPVNYFPLMLMRVP